MKTARFNKAQYLGFYRARSPRLRAAPCSSVTMVSVLRRSARRSVVGLAVGVDTASDSRVVDGLLVSAVLLPFARLGRYAAVGQGGQTSDGRLCPGSYQVMPPGRSRACRTTQQADKSIQRLSIQRQQNRVRSMESQTHR